MALSPRMIQSMEILQLASLALEERIEQELETNPLLELAEVKPQETEGAAAAEQAEAAAEQRELSREREMVMSDAPDANAEQDFARTADMADQLGDEWVQNTQESADYHTPIRDNGERNAKMDAMANTASRGASLADQLLDQWRFVEADEALLRAGEHLIEFIDDDGYLRTEMEQVLNQAPPGVTEEHLAEALALLKDVLEPRGIGAADLRECMLIQIDSQLDEEDLEEEDRCRLLVARRIIVDHLDDLEMNRLPKIAQGLGVGIEQIKRGLEKLKRLDPRPGRRLAPEPVQVIVPDVQVEYDPVADSYVAAMSRGRQPALRINPQYRALSKDRTQDKETRNYLARNMTDARWLIDALRQRNSTLLRVVNVVIEAQRDFLDHGPQHLKPLPMIQVADQLGIHVATVSRAVADKYVQTPRGIYPLRMFFSGGTESASGQEMSWSAVQAKLKEIIDNEDGAKPFSDDALVAQLKEKGIDIARRTVAKYRQQMNIPPARRRKKF
jgi:RNA polymerase sigma-54 factor